MMINNDEQGATANSTRKNRSLFVWTPLHCDVNFQARFFVNRVVDNLVDGGLGLNDFYYDLKENLLENPLRCSSRMRAVEQCQAAIVFLIWPTNKDNGVLTSEQQQQALLSVGELAELSVLCVRSMPPSSSTEHSTEAGPVTKEPSSSSSSTQVKLFVVCCNRPSSMMAESLLPPSLDYALSRAGRYSAITLSWSPSDTGITTSQLREMAAAVAGELIAIGIADWCRSPTSVASRAAWLSTAATQRSTTAPLDVKIPGSGVPSRGKNEDDGSDYNNNNNEDVGADNEDTGNGQAMGAAVKNDAWKQAVPLDWSPDMVQDFLASIRVPEVISMRVDELALDGSELSIMEVADFQKHILIDNIELCRILHRKIRHQLSLSHSLSQFAYTASKRQLSRVYIIYDPRDAKLAHQLHRWLERQSFEVSQHGQLGRSRSEFALSQLPKIAQCAFFVVLLTETALSSPFVWEEVCLLRSVIQPPVSSIIALSWNIGASFYNSVPTVTVTQAPHHRLPLELQRSSKAEEALPLPSLLLLLADVQNIPLLIRCDITTATMKASRLIESAVRSPPPGIVLSTPANDEYGDILAPNASSCDSLLFQPLLTSLGQSSSNLVPTNSKQLGRYGYLISNFLQPFGDAATSLPFRDHRMLLLNSIYIAPPIDVVLLCDWTDARTAAVPLLAALRNAGLRCFADFENPLSTKHSAANAVPKARLRLLLLTASTGHLRPSHPLLSTAITESPMSPLLFVLCSQSPIASAEETPPATKTSGISTSLQKQQHNLEGPTAEGGGANPSALLLDMSGPRGIARFVHAVCRYLGHQPKR